MSRFNAEVEVLDNGVSVRLVDCEPAAVARFEEAFPKAWASPGSHGWTVGGQDAERRVRQWVRNEEARAIRPAPISVESFRGG